jgi:hypothetical protein
MSIYLWLRLESGLSCRVRQLGLLASRSDWATQSCPRFSRDTSPVARVLWLVSSGIRSGYGWRATNTRISLESWHLGRSILRAKKQAFFYLNT